MLPVRCVYIYLWQSNYASVVHHKYVKAVKESIYMSKTNIDSSR